VTENAPVAATENAPAVETENVPVAETENAPAPATANAPAAATALRLLQEIQIAAVNQPKTIMYLQTRTEMSVGRIWMDGRRKIKAAGVIRSNLLKLAAIWIINIKQGNAGQPTREIISREQDRQLHVLHRVGKHNHRVQEAAEAAEAAEEEVVAEEVEEVEAEEADGGKS